MAGTPAASASSRFGGGQVLGWEEDREIYRASRRWGIDPKTSDDYKAFMRQVNSIVVASIDGNINVLLDATEPGELSTHDPLKGIRQFLKVEMEAISVGGESVQDMLDTTQPGLPFRPPFIWDHSKEDYVPHPDYRNIESNELNPLRRIVSLPIEGKQGFRRHFQDDDHPHQHNDMVLRAMVACRMTSAPCLACHAPTLCWNKAVEAKWRRMFCTTCCSVYDIRTKQNLPEKLSMGTITAAGRFDAYHEVSRDLKAAKPSAKMFVALIDVDSFALGQQRRRVFGAEIGKVGPFLKTKSFTKGTSGIRVYSKITLKNHGEWIVIPNYAVDAKGLVGEAIDRFFEQQDKDASTSEGRQGKRLKTCK